MIIYAPNVHSGGGKVLLESLLAEIHGPCTFVADTRFHWFAPEGSQIQRLDVAPRIWSRLKAEFQLWSLSKNDPKILCFGNLPPLLPVSTPVTLFFQNTILLKKYSHFPFAWKTRIKQQIERWWLRWGLSNVAKVIVQTELVKKEFSSEFGFERVEVVPFGQPVRQGQQEPQSSFDFVYVSSGDPHKNHQNLFSAWEILAKNQHFPSLAMTLPENATELLARLSQLHAAGLKVTNFSDLNHEQVLMLYQRSRALVFPSYTESFGLPLLEAKSHGLQIVASELDYVRELVSPAQSFDPHSPLSIARAVARFLGYSNLEAQQKIHSAAHFLTAFLDDSQEAKKPQK